MKVAFSDEARTDVRDILSYLQARNPPAAKQVANRIERRCLSLSRHPERGPIIETRRGRALRRIFELPFVIIYTLEEHRVLIVRVFHTAPDGQALLDDALEQDGDF